MSICTILTISGAFCTLAVIKVVFLLTGITESIIKAGFASNSTFDACCAFIIEVAS